MAAKKDRPPKGAFGSGRLPLTLRYAIPESRRGPVKLGLAAAAAGLAVVALGAWLSAGRQLSPGPVASAHAGFEASCASCHSSPGGVEEQRCLLCHDRRGLDAGTFSTEGHFNAFAGLAVAGEQPPRRTPRPPCAGCHPEHDGRGGSLTAVPDSRCAACHGFASFSDHPELAFARLGLPDDPGLKFPHRLHVRELERGGLLPRDAANPQLTCLYCHNPEEGGAGFAPLEFDRHCAACHLTGGETTPMLPIADPQRPDLPGVETPEQMVRRGGFGTRWAYFVNPEEFTVRGSKVRKGPLNHADPWVMGNLDRIRRRLRPRAGLASLLRALPANPIPTPAAAEELYLEALASLAEHAEELAAAGDPQVQAELDTLRPLLQIVDRRLVSGEALEPDAFDSGPPATDLGPREAQAWRDLAAELAQPCIRCHLLEDGAILRVDQEQVSLPRARFHHRQHVIQRPLCTDCHGAIPDLFGRESFPAAPASGPGPSAAAAPDTLDPVPEDLASTQNLPRLAVCQECHQRKRVSDACVTCHRFHPREHFRAGLLLLGPLVEEAASEEGT